MPLKCFTLKIEIAIVFMLYIIIDRRGRIPQVLHPNLLFERKNLTGFWLPALFYVKVFDPFSPCPSLIQFLKAEDILTR